MCLRNVLARTAFKVLQSRSRPSLIVFPSSPPLAASVLRCYVHYECAQLRCIHTHQCRWRRRRRDVWIAFPRHSPSHYLRNIATTPASSLKSVCRLQTHTRTRTVLLLYHCYTRIPQFDYTNYLVRIKYHTSRICDMFEMEVYAFHIFVVLSQHSILCIRLSRFSPSAFLFYEFSVFIIFTKVTQRVLLFSSISSILSRSDLKKVFLFDQMEARKQSWCVKNTKLIWIDNTRWCCNKIPRAYIVKYLPLNKMYSLICLFIYWIRIESHILRHNRNIFHIGAVKHQVR